MTSHDDSPEANVPAPPLGVAVPCPLCGKPAQLAYRPFCSKRCSDLDLSRWLNGVYAIPARETDEDEDDENR